MHLPPAAPGVPFALICASLYSAQASKCFQGDTCKDALRLSGGWRTHRKLWQFSRLPQLVLAGRLLESLLSGMPGELTYTHTYCTYLYVYRNTYISIYHIPICVCVSPYHLFFTASPCHLSLTAPNHTLGNELL